MSTGFVAAFATHWIGHYAATKYFGYDLKQDGLNEVIIGPATDNEYAWIARSGFILPIIINAGIKYGPWSNEFKTGSFAMGYWAGTTMETALYPLSEPGGDITMIDKDSPIGGYGEWGIYSVTSLLLMPKQPKNKTNQTLFE